MCLARVFDKKERDAVLINCRMSLQFGKLFAIGGKVKPKRRIDIQRTVGV